MNGMLYVYKSMLNKLQNDQVIAGWRSQLIFILLATMMASLFISRPLLSVSMIAFAVVCFIHPQIKSQLRRFFATPLLWSMSLLFLLPLISGLWSEDKAQWLDIVRIKLPLLVMPLAFAAPFAFSSKQWNALAVFFILLITAATAWAMFHYSRDMVAVNESYLRAKTLTTPLHNDHVRFSWLVSVAILLSGWKCWQKEFTGWVQWLLIIVTAWLIVFLHILAARTGIFSFYIMLISGAGWLLFKKRKTNQAATVVLLLCVLPVAAYFALPSFRNRVKLIRYEFDYFKHADYLRGSNDGVRVVSWKAGWQVIKKHPVAGVGFGDINQQMKTEYAIHFPSMEESDKILPGNEWLIYGAGCGWAGILIFSIVMLIPLFTFSTGKTWWVLLNITAAFGFLFDMGLEVQFGVFIYSFVVLWWWKMEGR
jgi:O-antigen ligase